MKYPSTLLVYSSWKACQEGVTSTQTNSLKLCFSVLQNLSKMLSHSKLAFVAVILLVASVQAYGRSIFTNGLMETEGEALSGLSLEEDRKTNQALKYEQLLEKLLIKVGFPSCWPVGIQIPCRNCYGCCNACVLIDGYVDFCECAYA